MLLVDGGHQRSCWRENFVDEDKDGLVRGQLDTLADDVDELADGEVCWHQVLLLVDSGDVALLNLLADNLEHRGVNYYLHSFSELGGAAPVAGGCSGDRAVVHKVVIVLTGIRSRYF